MIDHSEFSVSYVAAYLSTLDINEEVSSNAPEIINTYITYTFVFNFILFIVFTIMLLIVIYTGLYESRKIHTSKYSHKFEKYTHNSQIQYYNDHELPYIMIGILFWGLLPLAGMYFTKVWIDILISKRYFLEKSIENYFEVRSGSLESWHNSFLTSINSISLNADRFYSIFYAIIILIILSVAIFATIKISMFLKNNGIKKYYNRDNSKMYRDTDNKNVYEIYITSYLTMYMVLSFIILLFSVILFYKPFLVSLFNKELFIFLSMD